MRTPDRGEIAETGITELLATQAATRPDHVAVVHEDDTLTYLELHDAATDLGRCLRGLGVRGDRAVGVFVEPSLAVMTGVWGVLYAGGAYLPLSPDYPDERLRFMLEQSRVRVVYTQEELRGRLAEIAPANVRIVTSDDVAEFRKNHGDDDGEALLPWPRPGDLAYVVYTSGSTGKPKGVMIEHRSVAHQMRWLAGVYGLDADAVVLQKTPMSFDAAQWEILAVAHGARVVVGTPGIHRDPARVVELVEQRGVTVLQCVPTLLQALVDTDELHRCVSLRRLFSGGEALSRALARTFLGILPGCTLVNLYGPTECTINTSSFTVDPAALSDGAHSVPIGTPVAGTRYHVLGPDLRPVAPGETGELYISGVQLARGYLHRPDLTAERFVDSPFGDPAPHDRLYRTGDLAHENPDGTVQFTGRADNQVKLRGFRIELDEIRLAVEAHDWVRGAAVLVRDDPRTGFQNLVACIELSPREAALMDQGDAGDHHRSKADKLQVKAQLSDPGTREDAELAGRPVVALPGAEATAEQRRRAFARKTYRFYEGGAATAEDVLTALARRPPAAEPRRPENLTLAELGCLLRDFGPHLSDERLLPKYAYASPGSLYATQLLVETAGVDGLDPGTYYFHPRRHQLVRVGPAALPEPGVRLHFLGRRTAIEPVYKRNVQEVLEFETGHMLGLLDEVLPAYGLAVRDLPYDPGTAALLDGADGDHYLGSFALAPYTEPPGPDPVDVYLQVHPGTAMGLPTGQYLHEDGGWRRVGDGLVLKRHVIAINQQVYERACFGVTLVSRAGPQWRRYIDLGRALQRLQHNDCGLGFMSSGYSSRTGHDLPAARRIAALLEESGRPAGPSYFAVGGRVSERQRAHEGMHEDSVHMKGPAEMVKDDLVGLLPEFMVPNHILVLDRLPLTANGKVDTAAVAARVDAVLAHDDRPLVPPRTRTEARLAELWKAALKRDTVSVRDDFFACGGNSIIAVALVHRVNREFGTRLPFQVVFEAPTVERLAQRVDTAGGQGSSRLVPLHTPEGGRPVFCWPGLGGYTMNLRLLAARAACDRPFRGVQAHGLNPGETPHACLEEMAAADVAAIRAAQPSGPYTLWGYSFGARVAYEAAWQLEQAGEQVDHLLLIAPGSPRLREPEPDEAGPAEPARTEPAPEPPVADFSHRAFRTVLFSVFAGAVTGPLLEECLRQAADEESFADFVARRLRRLDPATALRVIRLVRHTYGWLPAERRITAPVTVLPARGDEESHLERLLARTGTPTTVARLDAGHYDALRDPGVDELEKTIRRVVGRG